MAKKTTAKPRVSVRLRNLLKRFESAAVAYWRLGRGDPDDTPVAEKNYLAARTALIAFLVEMQESRAQLADAILELNLACLTLDVPVDVRKAANDARDRFDKSP